MNEKPAPSLAAHLWVALELDRRPSQAERLRSRTSSSPTGFSVRYRPGPIGPDSRMYPVDAGAASCTRECRALWYAEHVIFDADACHFRILDDLRGPWGPERSFKCFYEGKARWRARLSVTFATSEDDARRFWPSTVYGLNLRAWVETQLTREAHAGRPRQLVVADFRDRARQACLELDEDLVPTLARALQEDATSVFPLACARRPAVARAARLLPRVANEPRRDRRMWRVLAHVLQSMESALMRCAAENLRAAGAPPSFWIHDALGVPRQCVPGSEEEFAARLTVACEKAGHAVLFRVEGMVGRQREALAQIRSALVRLADPR